MIDQETFTEANDVENRIPSHVGWTDLLGDPEYARKSALYFRAGLSQHSENWVMPEFVPSRLRLDRDLRGDWPVGHLSLARAGDHDCKSNKWGAVSVIADDGSTLGVKPDECVFLEWVPNPFVVKCG